MTGFRLPDVTLRVPKSELWLIEDGGMYSVERMFEKPFRSVAPKGLVRITVDKSLSTSNLEMSESGVRPVTPVWSHFCLVPAWFFRCDTCQYSLDMYLEPGSGTSMRRVGGRDTAEFDNPQRPSAC